MKTLSEEHKKNISKSVKMRWERGDFDSEEIRNIWRTTALNGIAKKGREGPNKRVPSQEMLDDLFKMGDQDFISKWNVSRIVPIKLRKRYGIQSFIKQHGTVEHKFENGVEYKWCQKGHWESVENFGKHTSRYDGLRGWCKSCERKKSSEYYDKNDGAKKMRDWLFTDNGKKSRSATMRRNWMKRKSYYVKFELDDEERIYNLCSGACAYCKTPLKPKDVEFDHFVPVKLGGLTKPDNMLPSCIVCNRGRGGKFDKEPRAWLIQKFGQHFGEMIYQDCVSILESMTQCQ